MNGVVIGAANGVEWCCMVLCFALWCSECCCVVQLLVHVVSCGPAYDGVIPCGAVCYVGLACMLTNSLTC